MKIRDILNNKEYKESRIILSYIKSMGYSKLLTVSDQELSDEEMDEFLRIQSKLKDNYPLQYAIGKWNFFGYDFKVTEDVLIPRPETEILVEMILKNNLHGKRILDIGTGSGAIALTIDLESRKKGQIPCVTAVDISEEAIKIAKYNAENLGANVDFIQSDLFEKVEEKYDIIVSNPPYITEKDYKGLEKELFYEPKLALVGGVKGYEIYDRIIESAKSKMNEKAMIVFEIGYDQGEIVSDILKKNGFFNVKVFKDFNKIDRIVLAYVQEVKNV
ncbi:MAG: peptide chain release factor N(5)-glutamine methyltransferase [Tissierellia bacterium]|nr:peptide chain release factor N(5)-glutamine methyltransferase [Tissierellia bacterium]